MCFLMKIFCFLLVLNYVTTKTFVEFSFSAMPLGHSGLLIYWKPNIETQSEETIAECFFEFSYTEAENNNESYKFDHSQRFNSREKNKKETEPFEGRINSSAEQYKIHSLKENALYNVTIKQYSEKYSRYLLKVYSVERRTNLKSKRIPAKPYFEIKLNQNRKVTIEYTLRWYPCGRERICNFEESGTHFGITVKDPYNTRKFNEVTKEELYLDYIEVLFWPGVLYEVIPYSVNGGYKTYSDSQEIFVNPTSTPVRYVNIISLPDLSILISWKPPKELLDESLYGVFVYLNLNDPNADETDQVVFEDSSKKIKNHSNVVESPFEQTILFGLQPEVMYTSVLFPVSQSGIEKTLGIGFPYRIKHELQVYNEDLPIAKPDFNYKSDRSNPDSEVKYCNFTFQWLPCGKSFDCGSSKPGSNYSFQIRPEPLKEEYIHKHGYYEGDFLMSEIYTVILTSSIGNNLSEPVTKMFGNCDEIRDEL